MAKIDGNQGNEKNQNGDHSIPLETNPPKTINCENTQDAPKASEEITQEPIKNVNLITDKPLLIQEGRFEKFSFGIQTILAVVGLFTFVGFVIFSIVQHKDSVDALILATRNSDSADIATKKSLSLTEKSLKIASGSLEVTRASNILAEKSYKEQLRAYMSLQVLALSDIRSGQPLKGSYTMVNVGKTPAKHTWSGYALYMGYEKPAQIDYYAKELRDIMDRRDKQGFVIGANTPYPREINSEFSVSKHDSTLFFTDANWRIYLIILTQYYDKFDSKHFTWTCVFFNKSLSSYAAYHKYNDAD